MKGLVKDQDLKIEKMEKEVAEVAKEVGAQKQLGPNRGLAAREENLKKKKTGKFFRTRFCLHILYVIVLYVIHY